MVQVGMVSNSKRVATKVLMEKRNVVWEDDDLGCPWCSVEAEECDHLLLLCEWPLESVVLYHGVVEFQDSNPESLEHFKPGVSNCKKIWRSIFAASVWHLW